MSMKYVCICGRVFDSSNKLNAHKGHCLQNLGQERFDKSINHLKNMSVKGTQKIKDITLNNRLKQLNDWINQEHKCEKCDKIMTEKYGSGRFCSVTCANSHKISDDTKRKIGESVIKSFSTNQFNQGTNYKYLFGYYNNIFCSSGYELIYVLYCEQHNIKVERCKFTFEYEYKNKKKLYIPDFYLPESNTIVELKGRNEHFDCDKNKCKMKSIGNNFNYKIIYDNEFRDIYLKWAKEYYKFSNKEYGNFCRSKYEDKCTYTTSKKHNSRTKNYTWIHKNNRSTLVKRDELENYLSQNWELGRC